MIDHPSRDTPLPAVPADSTERLQAVDTPAPGVAPVLERHEECGERVQPGDRVAAFLPNLPETVIGMLAATSIGAVWSSCSPDFGTQGVLDRFGQIEPSLLVVADGYHGHITFDARADDRDVAFDIGVVGRLDEARSLPPVPAAGNGGDGGERHDGSQDQLAHGVIPHSNLSRQPRAGEGLFRGFLATPNRPSADVRSAFGRARLDCPVQFALKMDCFCLSVKSKLNRSV